jgi:hypothetical protein
VVGMNGNGSTRGKKNGHGNYVAVGPDESTQNHGDAPSPAVSGVLDERIRNLREAIQEIDDALARRKILNFRFLEQIDHERDAAMHQLETLQPPWRTGFYPQIEFLRLSLHKSVTSRATDHRREQLKYWEDAVNLNKERRKFVDEYKALMGMRTRLSND